MCDSGSVVDNCCGEGVMITDTAQLVPPWCYVCHWCIALINLYLRMKIDRIACCECVLQNRSLSSCGSTSIAHDMSHLINDSNFDRSYRFFKC